MVKELRIGEPAPDFLLPSVNGGPVTLNDFKGRWVILYFYPKDNTPGCTIQAKEFTAELKELEDMNAVVLGISSDSQKSHLKFSKDHSLGITLLSDKKREVMEDYGVWKKKKIFGKVRESIVRTTFIIDPDGNIARAWYGVKAEGNAQKAKETLQKLQKGSYSFSDVRTNGEE